MPTYVILQKAADYGSAGIIAGPSSGAERQAAAVSALGGTVMNQFAVLGQYDVVLVADFPDDETVLAFSLRAQEEGFYTHAMRAFTPHEADSAVARLTKLEPGASA